MKRILQTAPTVKAALAEMERHVITEKITERKCGQVCRYANYLDIMNKGMDPLDRVRWIWRDRQFPNATAWENLTLLRLGLTAPRLLTYMGKHQSNRRRN